MKLISLLCIAILFFAVGCAFDQNVSKRLDSIETKIDGLGKQMSLAYSSMDANRDLIITKTEFDSWLRRKFTLSLSELDSNGDRMISKMEFIKAKKTANRFDLFDKDNNGAVSESEFVDFFASRFQAADRSGNGQIDFQDTGIEDSNKNGMIDQKEYIDAVQAFVEELKSAVAPKGYGYAPCSSQYVICDASCVRCIALFIPAGPSGSWGSASPGPGVDPCAGVNTDDPWGPDFDPMHPCNN